ncbi:hypothetical protein [Deinococcus sp.]|uniref:hypothetical protein n=1 Tax=Deinococcus sp. TaxID=47478 RepID=UPI003C7E6C3F
MDEQDRNNVEALTQAVKAIADATARSRAFEATLIEVLVEKGVISQEDAEAIAQKVRTLVAENQSVEGLSR